MQGNARHKHPHTGGQCSGDQKKARRRFVSARTEGIADERERRVDFVFEIVRHHYHGQDQPTDGVAKDDLDKAEIAILGKEHRRHADKGKRASLGGHDGESHTPPRQIASAEKVVARGFLAATEPDPQGNDAGQITRDHCPIQRGQGVVGGEHRRILS